MDVLRGGALVVAALDAAAIGKSHVQRDLIGRFRFAQLPAAQQAPAPVAWSRHGRDLAHRSDTHTDVPAMLGDAVLRAGTAQDVDVATFLADDEMGFFQQGRALRFARMAVGAVDGLLFVGDR